MRNTEPVLLAIDTSTRAVGLAVFNGSQVLAESVWESNDFHTVELAPAVVDMLARARLNATDIGAIAVALGPGSFTGLRIGLALAKGLSIALRIPLIGVPTLDILAAAQAVGDFPLVVVLRAGRGRLATARYEAGSEGWQLASNIEVWTSQELTERLTSPVLVCGELSAEERRLIGEVDEAIRLASPAQSVRRPACLAEIGWQRWQSGRVDDPAALSPIYLHYNDPIPVT